MTNEEILRSWKEIADYLKCDKKTCSRWEEECGLPVRRFDDQSPRSRVFAYKSELDQWLAQKANNRSQSAASRPRRKVPLFAVPLAVIACAVPAFWFFGKKSYSPGGLAPVIVVLPIRYQNPTNYDRYLADGLTKELIQRLAVSMGVRVTTAPWPQENDAPAAVPSKRPDLLIADYAIQGDIQKKQDNLSFSVLLNDERKKRPLWQKNFETKEAGLAPCLDQVINEIRKQLSIKGSRNTLSASVFDSDAFDASLKGRYLLDQIGKDEKDPWTLFHKGAYYTRLGDQETNELAIQLFNQAREIDPKFAAAYLGLAECYLNYLNFNWRVEMQWLDKAKDLIDQAQRLTPNLPLYYALSIRSLWVREVYLGEDNSRAYFDLAKEGLERYPYDGRLNAVVGYCHYMRFDREGRESDFDEALKLMERAFYADRFTIGNMAYSELLMLKGDYDKAHDVCDTIEKNRPSEIVNFMRAEIYYFQGRLDESEKIFLTYTQPVSDKIAALYFLGMIAARRNDAAAASKFIEEIEMTQPKKEIRHLNQLQMASICAGIRETEKAQSLLRMIFSDGKSFNARHIQRKYMEIDPNFSKIRAQFAKSKIIPLN